MGRYISLADHQRVSDAIGAAEGGTAGEIVTVIADRSDSYADVALAWSTLAGFTALALFALFPGPVLGTIEWVHGVWNYRWTDRVLLGIATAIGILVFFAAWLALLAPALRFALIPGPVKTARALGHAIDLFKVGAERRTHGRTGVLIYLSMREHRAEIVADEAIASKVPPETWGEAMAALLAHLKEGRTADGMIAAVEQVGAVLAEHFPRHENDINELPDRLIEL